MTHSNSELIASTPAQKRALSYANTILNLFSEVMSTQKPADRILANYFREHKKHGSKDRRIIRETLFGLFRWWGWLKQNLSSSHNPATVDAETIKLLLATALLEQHSWEAIIQAWAELSETDVELLTEIQTQDAKIDRIEKLYPQHKFELTQLLPESFWSHIQLSEEQQSKLADSMLSRPPIWARAQFEKTETVISSLESDDINISRSEFFNDALNLGTKSINLPQVKAYQQGKLEIQDLASQVIGNVCSPKPDEQWWDACAGAGGKSLQLASLMSHEATSKPAGKIISSDIRNSALEELSKRAKRANTKLIKTQYWKTESLPVKENYFDGVLVDAPCTCTGTWRRNPDMRWTDTLENVEDTANLQLHILTQTAQAVKSGGTLVYATCSLLDKENRHVVEGFLADNPEFELVKLIHPFTGEAKSYLTIWPYEANSDGMFVAKMIKK
ncbi:SAM-dependent methyltransferase [Shewanella sp. OPT22]|nr:SAM-dependent methyltransferase [Shewanella sp. OPT22]